MRAHKMEGGGYCACGFAPASNPQPSSPAMPTYQTTLAGFQRDPTALLADEFRRLALARGWGKKSARYGTERVKFYGTAVVQDFARFWGDNDSRLQAWQELCHFLGVPDCPSSITQCKKVCLSYTLRRSSQVFMAPTLDQTLKHTHVNLIDLVDARRRNVKPRIFSSRNELATYIRETGKIFPKGRAKANPLLKQFLVVVFGEY